MMAIYHLNQLIISIQLFVKIYLMAYMYKFRELSIKILIYQMASRKNNSSGKNSKDFKHWANQQDHHYHFFLILKLTEFESGKRESRLFINMNQFIPNKEPSQCRSHHQKKMKRYKTIRNALHAFFRQQYTDRLLEVNHLKKQVLKFINDKRQILSSEKTMNLDIQLQNNLKTLAFGQSNQKIQHQCSCSSPPRKNNQINQSLQLNQSVALGHSNQFTQLTEVIQSKQPQQNQQSTQRYENVIEQQKYIDVFGELEEQIFQQSDNDEYYGIDSLINLNIYESDF